MLLRLRIDSVFVVTGLRIQALHFVNAPDFSFSGGYLGLLSELGCLMGVIFCCVPYLPSLFRQVSKYAPIKRIRQFNREPCCQKQALSQVRTLMGLQWWCWQLLVQQTPQHVRKTADHSGVLLEFAHHQRGQIRRGSNPSTMDGCITSHLAFRRSILIPIDNHDPGRPEQVKSV